MAGAEKRDTVSGKQKFKRCIVVSDSVLENGNYRTRDNRETRQSAIEKHNTLPEKDEPVMSREFEVGSWVKSIAELSANRTEVKSLVVLQFSCWNVYNKTTELWNLVDAKIPMLLLARNHGLRMILAILKSSGMISQLSEGIGLSVVVGFLSVLKISLPVRSYG